MHAHNPTIHIQDIRNICPLKSAVCKTYLPPTVIICHECTLCTEVDDC